MQKVHNFRRVDVFDKSYFLLLGKTVPDTEILTKKISSMEISVMVIFTQGSSTTMFVVSWIKLILTYFQAYQISCYLPPVTYIMFHRFGQAKFAYGGPILGSSQLTPSCL